MIRPYHAAALRISPDGLTLQLPAGSNPILNSYAANALEEARKIKERRGGSVPAVALGAESVKDSRSDPSGKSRSSNQHRSNLNLKRRASRT